MNPKTYIADQFPLEQLFQDLRGEGVALGLEDLLVAQEALQFGLGLESASSLQNLLRMLWLGSKEEFPVFDKCFSNYIASIPEEEEIGKEEDSWEERTRGFDDELTNRGSVPEEEAPDLPSPPKSFSPPSSAQPLPTEEASVTLSASEKEDPRKEVLLVSQHDPSSPLSLRRNWQKLRSESPSFAELDLDIRATVENIARQGYFDQPVMVPRPKQDLNLLLFIDAGGSMEPLMDFCNRWQDTVMQNVRFREARKCYFRNIPEKTVFTGKGLKESIPLRRFWANIPAGRTIALVLSDLGAARKSWDSARILDCRDFSRILNRKGFEQLWLNPMRREWWEGSSAAKVAELVPQMLSLDPADTRKAITYINRRMERRQS